jgi:hypothetical protein
VATLRLWVDGDDAVLGACELHADWLRAYIAEDPDVRLLDDVPEQAPLLLEETERVPVDRADVPELPERGRA